MTRTFVYDRYLLCNIKNERIIQTGTVIGNKRTSNLDDDTLALDD
ncbi:hypothetical protein MASR1M60_03480 [Rhodocyclaceae bacterium]